MSEVSLDIKSTKISANWFSRKPGYLHSPFLDFMGLGGASLLSFVIIFLFFRADQYLPALIFVAMFLANFINHPHFAHSYQIFYRDFGNKLRSSRYSKELRLRYWFSGVIAPIIIAGFLISTFLMKRPDLMGYALSVMFFLVGWHYVKQGYGMAMVDAALKKQFFNGREKKALLINAYATWMVAWTLGMRLVAERDYFGFSAYSLNIPDVVFSLIVLIALCSLVYLCGLLSYAVVKERRQFAVNGLMAYAISLYPWLFIDKVNLAYFALVPAFHSLQYMTVVWRYELNSIRQKLTNEKKENSNPVLHFFGFYGFAAIIGAIGFWLLPLWLELKVSLDEAIFTGSAFLFVFWVFINIHHYLMDNVMWRKGNPDVAEHLFAAPHKK